MFNKKHRRSGEAKNAIEGVLPVREFQDELRRERARVNRTSGFFSMVIYESVSTKGSVSALSNGLKDRLRSTDRLGWLKPDCLAALLPETTPTGAAILAQRVAESTAVEAEYSLYSYPGSPPAKNNSDRSETTRAGSEPSRDTPSGPVISERAMLKNLSPPVPIWKRFLDIVGALLILLVTAPVFVLVAIVIKTGSRGPILFCQTRIGYGGEPFTMLKFRTMRLENSPTDHERYMRDLIKSGNGHQAMEKIDEDLPLIPFGSLLRMTCLDELPQLINVLRGDMSLIGPRPCLPYEAEEYLAWHRSRFHRLPGMTGLWQVSGKNSTTFDQMVRLDIRYSRRMSLWLDSKIMLLTIPAVIANFLTKEGAKTTSGRDKC